MKDILEEIIRIVDLKNVKIEDLFKKSLDNFHWEYLQKIFPGMQSTEENNLHYLDIYYDMYTSFLGEHEKYIKNELKKFDFLFLKNNSVKRQDFLTNLANGYNKREVHLNNFIKSFDNKSFDNKSFDKID